MNKDKRNNIQLLGTLNNSDESGIIANANQVYDANEDKSTQDVSKEHKERIETLETKESSMQTTLENITKTGEASAASNVTYNRNDSQLNASNVQQAIDEVRKRSNYNDGDNIIDFNTINIVKDTSAFALAITDNSDKPIFGITNNGHIYVSDDLSKLVRELNTLVSKYHFELSSVDEQNYKKSNYNDEKGNVIPTNIIHLLLDTYLPYIKVLTDNVGHILEAILDSGIHQFNFGIKLNGTEVSNLDTYLPYIKVLTDNVGHILSGYKKDGTYKLPILDNESIAYLKRNICSKLIAETENSDLLHSEGKTSDGFLSNANGVYIGFNKVFEKPFMLSKISIELYKADNNDINTEYKFLIGSIDQRGWIITRMSFAEKPRRIVNNVLYFDFAGNNYVVNANEVMALYVTPSVAAKADGTNNIVPLYKGSSAIISTLNPNEKIQNIEHSANISIKGFQFDSPFVLKSELSADNESLSSLQNQLSSKQDSIMTDVGTGAKSRIVIYNGEVHVKTNRYKNIMLLGNSFTTHGIILPHTWNSNGRSMAASTNSCMWGTHLHNVIGSNVYRESVVEVLEVNNTTDFSNYTLSTLTKQGVKDLENKNVDITNIQFDCIIVQLGENISKDFETVYDRFDKFYKFLKKSFPLADIVCLLANYDSEKYQYIYEAAVANNLIICNCSDVSGKDPWHDHDYVLADDGSYFEMNNGAVYGGHPSDVGNYNIASSVLKVLGYSGDIPNRKFSIVKNQSIGGTISSPADYWISEGVVTIRCVADDGYEIGGVTVTTNSGLSVETTKHNGHYEAYTFIMPAENVVVTPTWNKNN